MKKQQQQQQKEGEKNNKIIIEGWPSHTSLLKGKTGMNICSYTTIDKGICITKKTNFSDGVEKLNKGYFKLIQ